jgi:Hint domain
MRATRTCCLRETRIRTPRGDVAIENLRVGDRVATASGATRPVKWLGHRRYRCTLETDPRDAWPIRVTAHAFGENQPDGDLFLSPGHSVRIAGVEPALVPISELVNGATIARAPMDEMDYWHVELDAHDVILAHTAQSGAGPLRVQRAIRRPRRPRSERRIGRPAPGRFRQFVISYCLEA